MAGFDLDTARDGSVIVIAAAVLIALVAVVVVKQVVTKVLTVVVLLALAGLVYSQRAELVDCADRVQARIDQGVAAQNATTCTFFARDVTLPGVPALTGNGDGDNDGDDDTADENATD